MRRLMSPITITALAGGLLAVSTASSAKPCLPPPVDPPRIFADVPFDHPFCEEIESLYRDGLTSGCRVEEDGTRYFCPDQALTRGMAAAFVEHRDPFALVTFDGKISIGDHVRDAERVSLGLYRVQFTRDIQRCAMEGWSQDRFGPGVQVHVVQWFADVDAVAVETTIDGAPTDMWFNVRIHCR